MLLFFAAISFCNKTLHLLLSLFLALCDLEAQSQSPAGCRRLKLFVLKELLEGAVRRR